MQAFVPVPSGAVSVLEDAERTVLARLFADTAELLGTRLTGGDDGDQLPTRLTPPRGGDDAVLAALDFDPVGHAQPDAPADPALARLLPPMSADDPALATELRGLTEQPLRSQKVENLQLVWRELRVPSGADGAVLVRRGQDGPWLSAMTDVRLVLAVRLGIEDDESAERVYARAHFSGRPKDPPISREEEVTDALATMYAALTWWQESLLEALLFSGPAD